MPEGSSISSFEARLAGQMAEICAGGGAWSRLPKSGFGPLPHGSGQGVEKLVDSQRLLSCWPLMHTGVDAERGQHVAWNPFF
jgi:hypothetical protein